MQFTHLDTDPIAQRQCCGSGMRISQNLNFIHLLSRIPGLTTATKEGEKICCSTFSCSHKYYKIENYFIFEQVKKKIWANLQRIFTMLTKIWVWDLGSEIWKSEIKNKPIPDPKGKKAPDPGYWSETLLKGNSYRDLQPWNKPHLAWDAWAGCLPA